MKDVRPHLVISLLGKQDNRAKELIDLAKEKLSEMGVHPFFVPENFSNEEILSWLSDITDSNDFFLNFSFSSENKIYFREQEEEEIAKIFTKEISSRTDEDYGHPTPLFSKPGDVPLFLGSLPLHTWDIHINPAGKSNQELVMHIMACITDLYVLNHSLIPEDLQWPFRDVPSSHFAFSAIKKAKESKIIPGYRGEILKPNGGVTRGEMLYILQQLGKLGEK